jgi:6-phosphogluconolactonase
MAVRTVLEADPNELVIKAAAELAGRIAQVCHERGRCTLGIVGGRTMPLLLDHLLPYAHQLKGRIDVFWLDERVHADKIYPPALPLLEHLHHAGVDIGWHPLQSLTRDAMRAELELVRGALHAVGDTFDVVVLSAGEDGHICALFPGNDALKAPGHDYVFVENSPKPPPLRVTVTPSLLLTARHAIIFFVGDKRAAYTAFTDKLTTPRECPAKFALQIPDVTVFVSVK